MIRFLFRTFIFTLAAATAHATVIWQYEAAAASSNEWRAARTGSSLSALHKAGNGWTAAEVKTIGRHKAMGFGEGASAFAFPNNATNKVAVVYAVVRSDEAGELATLIEAPYNVSARLASSWQWETSWHWQTEQLGYRASYRVNGLPTTRFEPSDAFRLVEIHFETPPEMRGLYVGNAAASPLWQRHWRGEIGELLFAMRELTELEQHALYNYFRMKWGIPLVYERVDTVNFLESLGVQRGPLFGSIFMVR
jgi:hypothetical protein